MNIQEKKNDEIWYSFVLPVPWFFLFLFFFRFFPFDQDKHKKKYLLFLCACFEISDSGFIHGWLSFVQHYWVYFMFKCVVRHCRLNHLCYNNVYVIAMLTLFVSSQQISIFFFLSFYIYYCLTAYCHYIMLPFKLFCSLFFTQCHSLGMFYHRRFDVLSIGCCDGN